MTFIKALAIPWTMIVYGEFTSLLVDRTERNEKTTLLAWFGGGRIL